MLYVLKRLGLGLLLITLTSGVLLWSDREQRRGTGKNVRLALMMHASQPVLLDGERGLIESLAEHGYVDGKTVSLKRFNAEGDIATANSIAQQMASGGYDLLLTLSTPSLQAVANANRAGAAKHVFGLVADPWSAGIGAKRDSPLDKPKWLTGIASQLPVIESFRMARKLNPNLTKVGCAWNPGESNSQFFTKQAKASCKELGIQFIDTNVDNSSGVLEAVNSVISRGAQAIWVGGDNTVLLALDSVITAANRARIPVFTITPGKADRGTLFDLGTDFYQIGRHQGEMASDVLHGKDPGDIPIENMIRRKLVVNERIPANLKDSWRFPADVLKSADVRVDAAGVHERKAAVEAPKAPPGRKFRIGIVYLGPEPGVDVCLKGLFDGLRGLGFVEGQNLEVKRGHANGEISQLPALLQSFDTQKLDLIVTMTTPVLTAACNTVRNTPVVFMYVFDPVAAGAGKSFTDHNPNVTGIGSFPPIAECLEVMHDLIPGLQSVGTLYNSSEANSRRVVEVARGLFKKDGVSLQEVTVTSSNDVMEACRSLVSRKVQAFWSPGDNTVIQAFSAVARVSQENRIPLFTSDIDFVNQGAVAGVGISFYSSGKAAASPAARVMLGADPGSIPFENVAVKEVVLNGPVAAKLGIHIPPALLQNGARVLK